jgi:hypothetical protein
VKIAVGKYTGTGSQLSITGVGFKPDFVWVQREAASQSYPLVRFDLWPANYSQDWSGIQQKTDCILSCDEDGFTVGTNAWVNANGGTYHYLCIAAGSAGDAEVGTYDGNGQNPRDIGMGITPVFVLCGARQSAFFWKIAGMESANACEFGYSNPTDQKITQLITGGMTVQVNANGLGTTYFYLALSDVSSLVYHTHYTGDGNDNRNFSGVPFQPDLVMIRQYAAAVNHKCVWKPSTVATADRSLSCVSNEGYLANAIQAINADGWQVGTDNSVNRSGGSYEYAVLCLKTGSTSDLSSKEGADSGQAAQAATLEATIPGADSGQAAETAEAIISHLVTKSAFDSAVLNRERAGHYWRDYKNAPWEPGVRAFYQQQQGGAATEGAGQVVHNQLATTDSGALADQKTEPPVVEHLRQEPAAGLDLAALWYEIALSESNAWAEEQAVVEITPVAGSDLGAGADAAETPFGYYERADSATAADAWAGLSAALSEIADAATALETAQRVAVLSRHIMECSIESSLDALADAFDLTLVESDLSDPLVPKAQAWRTLDEGDLVQVRLGLAGLGFDDYGVFRIDGAAVRISERQIVTELHGRDQAALLIEERGRDLGGFWFGSYPEQDPTQATRATCSTAAARLAARVGLGLVWDAPNYPLKEFVVRPDESVSSALSRLLGPLQVSRRYRADAWVDGDNLVVRRRGNGPLLGALDCRQGLIRSISRERQPAVGEVTVLGGTEVIRTTYVPEDHRDEKGPDDRQSAVEIEDDGSGHRVVKTYLQKPDGTWVQTQEEVEDQDFEEVWDGDRWIGRVLMESRTTITTNMHLSTRKTERRTAKLSYDGDWRLIRREESKRVYDSASYQFKLKEKSLVRFEQISPTDVRTTTTEWNVVEGELKVKKGYPTRVEQPGTLQSALHMGYSPDHAWDEKEDGQPPPQTRKVEETRQYHGRATGTIGGIPREHSDANLMSDGACQQIAEDIASESGQWLYQFELFWPRPLPYRKGDRVTLTNLPADLPDMIAMITRVRTQFSVAQAAWSHDIELECWGEG